MINLKHEAVPFALLVFVILIGAIILDIYDASITGDISLKSFRKKIQHQIQQAISHQPRPQPTPTPAPTPPPQVAISPTPTGQCQDSDTGWDLYKAGNVRMGPNIICTDRCATPEELKRSQGKDQLFECFCGNKQAFGGGQGSGWTDCQYGCKDAACITQQPAKIYDIAVIFDPNNAISIPPSTTKQTTSIPLEPSTPFTIHFTITNKGNIPASPGYEIRTPTQQLFLGYVKPPIQPGQSTTITDATIALLPGTHQLTIKITPLQIINEGSDVNPQNNEYTFTATVNPVKQPQLPVGNIRAISLLDKTFTRDKTVIDIQAVTFDKPLVFNFKIENQGFPKYEPTYVLQIFNPKGETVFQEARAKFDKPLQPGEQREISIPIDYEQYRGQMGSRMPQLQPGNYKAKITVGKLPGLQETTFDDNEATIPFTIAWPKPQTPPPAQPPAKLKEVSGERPRATYVTQQTSTITVVLPPEVGV